MKYLLIGVDDTTNLAVFDQMLHTHAEVRTVEIIESSSSTKHFHDPTGVLGRNLAIPGSPLTDKELEVLAETMDFDTSEGIPMEVVFDQLEGKIAQWSKGKA